MEMGRIAKKVAWVRKSDIVKAEKTKYAEKKALKK
jgi:translation initiation factor IF-1